jgi:hypothetical protein
VWGRVEPRRTRRTLRTPGLYTITGVHAAHLGRGHQNRVRLNPFNTVIPLRYRPDSRPHGSVFLEGATPPQCAVQCSVRLQSTTQPASQDLLDTVFTRGFVPPVEESNVTKVVK